MKIEPTGLDGVSEITMPRFEDERGWLGETWNATQFSEAGLDLRWEQDNESLSLAEGTLRGLHFQIDPSAQAKLVRAVTGRIFSVAVDLRRSSSSFGHWVGCELDAEIGNQMLLTQGFAHGFVTLDANCRVAYKVDRSFDGARARAIAWDDPAIGIDWPVDPAFMLLSDKDKTAPTIAQATDLFA